MELDYSAVPSPRKRKREKRNRLLLAPGQPQVQSLIRRYRWAVLYDEEGRMYGWLPKNHPLQRESLPPGTGRRTGCLRARLEP